MGTQCLDILHASHTGEDMGAQCLDTLHASNTGEKWEHNGTVHQLFIDSEKDYDSVRRKFMYNILTEFVITMIIVTYLMYLK
jgi:hypothetical protein